jgi:hypothetical protein
VLFSDRAARDVLARGKVSDGPIELMFHPWNVDRNAERTPIPYHVKISIEGLPQHAWFQELADKILGDVAVINHVDPATRCREDQRFFCVLGLLSQP